MSMSLPSVCDLHGRASHAAAWAEHAWILFSIPVRHAQLIANEFQITSDVPHNPHELPLRDGPACHLCRKRIMRPRVPINVQWGMYAKDELGQEEHEPLPNVIHGVDAMCLRKRTDDLRHTCEQEHFIERCCQCALPADHHHAVLVLLRKLATIVL